MNEEYQESLDFDLAIDVYVAVVIENREVARMSLDWPDDTGVSENLKEKEKAMRIRWIEPVEDEEHGEQEDWAASIRAIAHIMEVAAPLIKEMEEKLRYEGRKAWDNGNDTSPGSGYGYK